jgi:hypothetical protein
MANTTRQNSLLVNQDWTKVYESFRNADFQSYDFQTLRKSMIDYLRVYYPENFNDFIESSEYIALIDMIAFLGQSLAFRTDLNARENFLDTAERRDSVLKLAKLVSYNPKRNQTATGFLKFESVQSTQTLYDSNGLDLTNLIVKWNDTTNVNWYEQFVTILNAAMPANQQVGKPANSQIIGGITYSEYNINLTPGALPVYKFASQIETSQLDFEIVSGTSAGQSYIYEAAPRPSAPMNVIYKNDNLGNASNNTGFFFYFKQGSLASQNFSFAESIPNNIAAINVNNINNTDVWLYDVASSGAVNNQWNQVPTVNGLNIIYNSNAAKKSFQVASKAGDQINLIFGDGTFAAIPQGDYRVYYRTSTGLTYKITPDEMQNIKISFNYVSKIGRIETITIIASLKYTVANSLARESLTDIKTKAPQLYYTQNRMVTGEDYNTFPYANYNSIALVKAVNRTSSGVSRFLDVVDTTGRYSSTNIFAEDGVLYQAANNTSFDFTWNTKTDINRVIDNQILPVIRANSLLQFYYKNFTRFNLSTLSLTWSRSTVGSGSSTGYFVDNLTSANRQQIGRGVAGNKSYITQGSILIFSPGAGNYFNSANEVVALPTGGTLPQNGKSLLYVTVTKLVGNGSQGNLTDGTGPVVLSENVPSGVAAITVIPSFSNSFTTSFISNLISLIFSYTEFGIRFDQAAGDWKIIAAQDLDLVSSFSQANQGSTIGMGLDASWLLSFQVNGPIYNVNIRGLNYAFESIKETKFYFDNRVKVYDPVTGLTVNDSVNLLKVNGNPDTGAPLSENILWYITGQPAESDGYVNNNKVLVTFSDTNNDGVPDNPDIFNTVVQPTGTAMTEKYVFFVKSYGYNNFITYKPLMSGAVNSEFATNLAILPNINNYTANQIFYAYSTGNFYVLTIQNGVRTLVQSTDYIVHIGRQDLYFQYKHNSPGNRRLDPSPSNLIDLYILTKEYDADYRAWIAGNTTEPDAPSSESLRLSLGDLENYKSVSDAIIYSSAKFKPLFGNKAPSSLQATFKIIKNINANITDSEIRSRVLTYINLFFASGNWSFGETFYFTEMATYIQQSLAPNVSSIVIVPNSASQLYGSLQQISSEPNEILISAATVDNIEVISAITAAQLNLQTSTVNTLIN